MPEELTPLPCPFCGDSAFLYPDGDMEGHSVMCRGVADPNCASNEFGYSSEAEAIAAWNRRAQPAPSITEHQSKWGRLYTAANALIAAIGFHGRLDTDSPEVESLQDKLHDLDSGEWMPGLMPAQPKQSPLTEGALMGIYMEFDRHADKAWTPTEYLLRFAAAVDAHGIRGQG